MKRWTWLAAAAFLAACSSGALPTAPNAPGAMMPAGSADASAVTFVVVVPGGGRPRFISPSTQSVVVALGKKILLTMDVSASSRSCKPRGKGARTCTARSSAPSGKQIFGLTAFDQPGGAGNVLASGNVPVTLSAGGHARVQVALTGRPASLRVSLQMPYPPAGRAASTEVIVEALDADGNTIVGSYGTTIALSDRDPSKATTLSAASISKSSAKIVLAYSGAPLSEALLSARAPHLARATALFAPTPTSVKRYNAPPIQPSPPLPAGLWDLCIGPDGNIWATANSSGAIDKITPNGTFTAYPILRSSPMGISVGSDHDLWFAEQQAGAIGKITLAGKITSYPIPVPSGAFSQPSSTTLGPDGRTWFVDSGSGAVAAGAITSAGKMTKYALPAGSGPIEIASGPDGHLWITDGGLNALVVMSTSGKVVAVHRLRTPNAVPYGIVTGPDKNVWFTEFGAGAIGRMTTAGTLKEIPVPTAFGGPINITSGPDGNLWFAETGGGFWDTAGKIGYVTPDGSQIRDFPALGNLYHVHDLAFDASGSLWYTEQNGLSSALVKLIY